MQDNLPTTAQLRKEKLEYAFNSLINIPQVFYFKTSKDGINWLKKVDADKWLLGILLDKKHTYLLYKLERNIVCIGQAANQRCNIWVKIKNQERNNKVILGYCNSPTYQEKEPT